MKIARIENKRVAEILPEETYKLGAKHWYGEEFAAKCIEAPDNAEQGWVYSNGVFTAPVEEKPTPSQIREVEYENSKIIDWKGALITVNAAAQLVMYYIAEGDMTTVAELQALIAPVKFAIRAEHPDAV